MVTCTLHFYFKTYFLAYAIFYLFGLSMAILYRQAGQHSMFYIYFNNRVKWGIKRTIQVVYPQWRCLQNCIYQLSTCNEIKRPIYIQYINAANLQILAAFTFCYYNILDFTQTCYVGCKTRHFRLKIIEIEYTHEQIKGFLILVE